MQTYDIIWTRDSDPNEILSCRNLDPRTLVARLMNVLRHEPGVEILDLRPSEHEPQMLDRRTLEEMGPLTL